MDTQASGPVCCLLDLPFDHVWWDGMAEYANKVLEEDDRASPRPRLPP